jgi:hypothetical protein
MKKLLLTLLKILIPKKPRLDSVDDSIFEHLDGAEFGVVLPKIQTQPTVD